MDSLDNQLRRANERLSSAIQALVPKHRGGEQEEFAAAYQEVLRLERQLAAEREDEYAETIDFPLKWDTGAPLPQFLGNDSRTLLVFLLSEPDPNWDGTYVNIKSAAAPEREALGLITFDYCVSAKLGAPNDEVFEGHPLSGKGMEPYRAQRVINSRWIKELETINSIHRMYRPESWQQLNHYVFWFHDSTFECIARSYTVEVHRLSMKALLTLMVERLIS